MNVRRVLLVAFLVVVAAVVGGLFLYSQHLYRDSYGSEYTYEVRISPSATITNVTVLVPLPNQGGDSVLDTGDVQHPLTPDGWTYDVVPTDFGPMLRVQADEIPTEPTYHYSVVRDDRLVRWETVPPDEYDPTNESHLRVEHEDVEIDARVESETTIETRSPVTSEPLLRPHENRTETACFMARGEEETCYVYDGRVFVSYDADPNTTVYVAVELRGTNSWWVFGWKFNEYTDRQSVEVVGSRDGWIVTEGELETRRGNYRAPPESVPLAHPERYHQGDH
jgi:hypothetical protein